MAQRCTQVHHWQTKSFAKHLALGELYDAISEKMDEIAEMFIGISGITVDPAQSDANAFSQQDPVDFVRQLHEFLLAAHDTIPAEGGLLNKFEELQGEVARVKYKLEQLQ
jgi:DNA-binding ferritin-like protein